MAKKNGNEPGPITEKSIQRATTQATKPAKPPRNEPGPITNRVTVKKVAGNKPAVKK